MICSGIRAQLQGQGGIVLGDERGYYGLIILVL
jgi:hypothetical protein